MEQRCPRGNHPIYTTVAKFQASTQDLRDESSTSSTWRPQDKPPRSLHPHSSRSKRDESFEKGFWREKQKQCRFKHKRTNTRNVASMAGKDLSYLTCFNSDKKVSYTTVSRAKEEQRHLRKLVTVLVTSALKRLTWTMLPQIGFVYPVPYHLPRKIRVDSGSEVNAIYPTFAKKLDLRIRPIAPWNAFQRQGTENRRHHARYLWNGSSSL